MHSKAKTLRSKQSRRRAVAGLIACLAAPVTAVAALSGTIAPKLGLSQGSLLVADIVVAGILFGVCVRALRT